MAVDEGQLEVLGSYPEKARFSLCRYAGNEVVVEAHTDVATFWQGSALTEEFSFKILWCRALRCGSAYANWRLKSLFVNGLLLAACTQARSYLAPHTSADYQSVARFAEALESSSCLDRRQVAILAICDELDSKWKLIKPMPRDQLLSVSAPVDSANVEAQDGDANLLILRTGSTFTTTTASSPPISYCSSPAQSPAPPPQPPRP